VFTPSELTGLITDGLVNNALLPFTPVGYTEELVYKDWGTDSRARGSFVYSYRDHSWWLWMRPDQSEFVITHTGGVAFQDEGSAYIRIIDPTSDEVIYAIEAQIDVTATTTVALEGGRLYRVDIDVDGGIDFDWAGFHMTKITNIERSMFQAAFTGYFMVPAGTTVIGGYSGVDNVVFKNPAGTTIYTTVSNNAYFNFSITPPPTHEVWKFQNAVSRFTLLTVPPGIAMHPTELLVPATFA
jgi:hypothetical protein